MHRLIVKQLFPFWKRLKMFYYKNINTMTERYEKENNTCYTVEQFKKDLLNEPIPISIGKKLNDFLRVDFSIGGATALINDDNMYFRINLFSNILLNTPNHNILFFTWEKSGSYVYHMLLKALYYKDKSQIDIIPEDVFEKLNNMEFSECKFTNNSIVDLSDRLNKFQIYDYHPQSFSKISELIQNCIDRSKATASTTVFIDDIFTPSKSDYTSDCVDIHKRFNLVSDWFLDNNIHIFLGFNYCDTEKKEKIMNGNMRNVLECKNKKYLHVYKSRNGPTGLYPLDTFTKQ